MTNQRDEIRKLKAKVATLQGLLRRVVMENDGSAYYLQEDFIDNPLVKEAVMLSGKVCKPWGWVEQDTKVDEEF